jgi:MYXO-CTERM domain-containing protein
MSRFRTLSGLAAAAVLSITSAASAIPLVTDVVESGTGLDPVPAATTGESFNHPNLGVGFTVGTFAEDRPAFTDRTHQWNGEAAGNPLPAELIGHEYVMIANDNRGVANYQLDVSLSAPADLYVFIDQRADKILNTQWLAQQGWVATGQVVGVDENGDGVGPGGSIQNRSDVFVKKNVQAGVTSLFQAGSAGMNMYGVVATPSAGEADKFDILVDIGPSGAASRVIGTFLPGAPAAPGAPGGGTNNTAYSGTIMAANGEAFTLDISAVDWRDRGNSTNTDPFVRLGEDFVKNNAGDITLTLTGLLAGEYEMTTYHADPDNTQSSVIEVFVSDANGFDILAADTGNAGTAFGGVNGLTAGGLDGTAASFTFVSDGINPVSIRLNGTGGDTEVPLNGFSLSRTDIPEPASAMLGMLGLAALAARRRRVA